MKPMTGVLMLCIGIGVGAMAIYLTLPQDVPAAPQKPQPSVAMGDVTDLINRLKPLAERPEEDWHGVRVTITGGSAEVEITTTDGNKYTGKAKTLKSAATMIDSSRIREALGGWSPTTP